MAEQINAQFSSCTSLVEFQNANQSTYHKMRLTWILPELEEEEYEKVEIYRFVSELNVCTNPDIITDASPSKLIYTVTQNVDDTVTIERNFPYFISTTASTTLNNMEKVFVDDFSGLDPSGYDLDLFHSFPGIFNNKTIIDDIAFIRRTIYYILKVYVKGDTVSSDIAPYLVTPVYSERRFVNHSTKTQVKHNYLHYEGDEIWNAFVVDAAANQGAYGGISRTTVDNRRIHFDVSHAGPYGRGGSAWVSDRSSGNIMRYDMRNGAHHRTYSTGIKGRGFGIGIHTGTGGCIAGPGDTAYSPHTTPTLFYCDPNKTSPEYIMPVSSNRCCYGIIPLYNYSDRVFVTDLDGHGYSGILIIGNNLTDSRFIHDSNRASGYAAAAGSNGFGIQAGYNTTIPNFVHPEDARSILKNLSTFSVYSFASRIGADNHELYPNTLVNGTSSNRDYYCITHGSEFSLHVPFDAMISSDITVNWAVDFGSPPYIQTPGYDGENNLWSVGSNTKRKIYRSAADRIANDDIDESTIFPFGGNSRYKSMPLTNWRMSNTNTKEIEWFLTRNHGVSTYRADLGYSFKQIDAPSLDKTTAIAWDPARPYLVETAYDAWWNMVEQKMIRVYLSKQGNSNWKACPYFQVYNKDNVLDVNGRKWGIRMNVADVRAGRGKNLDDFYENYSQYWMSAIISRINSWANAFANINTSYPLDSNRVTMIEGNMRGVLVHPFYKFAQATPNLKSYINPSLPSETKTNIQFYMDNIKEYSFGSPMMPTLYMYSDFTGNMFSEASGPVGPMPLSIDKIHPELTDSSKVLSLVLLLSGYQSNPGYQDTPAYCYPWKNTIPSTFTTPCTAISGYDDFNVTFIVSANAGIYGTSTISISTDDYVPSYLSDTNNEAIITGDLRDNVVYLNYTYHTPSMVGITYIPSGSNNAYPAPSKPNGSFIPRANMQAVNLYDYTVNGCLPFNPPVSASITVFERWPEPKFFINAQDDFNIRQNFFCNSNWGRCP